MIDVVEMKFKSFIIVVISNLTCFAFMSLLNYVHLFMSTMLFS